VITLKTKTLNYGYGNEKMVPAAWNVAKRLPLADSNVAAKAKASCPTIPYVVLNKTSHQSPPDLRIFTQTLSSPSVFQKKMDSSLASIKSNQSYG